MTGRRFIAGLVFAAASLFAVAAHGVETRTWDDLAPKLDISQTVIGKLSETEKFDLSTLVFSESYENPTAERSEEEQQAYDRLKSQGQDPDALIAAVRNLRKLAERNEKALVTELDSKTIRVAGYLLPVDLDGSSVKSFFLVPYVGACIHVPPPPPNQIIYVESDTPFESDGMFPAVWVTGTMKVGMGTKALTLVDGSSGIDFGYTLTATSVEAYEE